MEGGGSEGVKATVPPGVGASPRFGVVDKDFGKGIGAGDDLAVSTTVEGAEYGGEGERKHSVEIFGASETCTAWMTAC